MTTIRTAGPDDLPAIARLTERLADFDLPPRRTHREIAVADHHLFRPQLESPRDDVLFLVAEDESAGVIGTIFARTDRDYFTHDGIAYVEVLAVAASAAGRGLARRLLEEVEAWAKTRSLVRVDLTVFALNRQARGFYEHVGYEAELVRYVKPLEG